MTERRTKVVLGSGLAFLAFCRAEHLRPGRDAIRARRRQDLLGRDLDPDDVVYLHDAWTAGRDVWGELKRRGLRAGERS